jgi:hypothetical protein
VNRTPAALLLVAVLAVFGFMLAWTRPAESQIQVSPSFVPVGVAASGNTSTAWFQHPASGRVVACQVLQTPAGGIHCTEGRLP